MRIMASFNGGGLTINFEKIDSIFDFGDYILLRGAYLTIAVNAVDICGTEFVRIQKSWLITANEVYIDTRIEEVASDESNR